jgi:outer membrane protein
LKLVQANDDFEKSYQDLVDYSQRSNMDTAILLSKRSITERLQANLKKDQEEAGKSYERLKADGLKAIISKIKIAVNEVAKQKGMAYIMDNSTGVLIVKDEAGNITETVMKKMGLVIPINLNE